MNRKTINILLAVLCFAPLLLTMLATFRTGEMPETTITIEDPASIMGWMYQFGTYFEVVTESNGVYTMPTGYYYATQGIMTSAAVELIECIPVIILWIPRRVKEMFE